MASTSPVTSNEVIQPKLWWSNGIFFVAVHLAALTGVYLRPLWSVPWATIFLSFITWQLGEFGITIGYHRLYSHRAFRAALSVRIVLALLGSSAFQGSIKWWSLRHRLHHRFTDDPNHDPYAATKGLLYSHMGWIFYKPNYAKLALVDRDDLDNDPVVRLQHKYYVPLAILFGFISPSLIGCRWGDATGAFVWAGLVSRVAIWHCTFLVNSLAHWDGLQPYSDEDTSRGNFILALLTSGEGNHNFHHTFPHDFRSGPSSSAWDPSKWVILLLHRWGLINGLRCAREDDIRDAIDHMNAKHHYPTMVADGSDEPDDEVEEEEWTMEQVEAYVKDHNKRCVLIINQLIIDATSYLGEHPGGARLLRRFALHSEHTKLVDASWAFEGGFNNHSRAAHKRLRSLALARIVDM